MAVIIHISEKVIESPILTKLKEMDKARSERMIKAYENKKSLRKQAQ